MGHRINLKPGDKFGKLTYVKDARAKVIPSGQKPRRVWCMCDCGRNKNVQLAHLVRLKVSTCGRCHNPKTDRQDVVGFKYGFLTITEELASRIKNGRVFRMVIGQCICGKRKKYTLSSIKGRKSCGCKTKEILKDNSRTHGLTGHPLYSIWNNMKNRCSNPKVESYKYYGAKGVKVCEEWKSNFKAFHDWSILNGWKIGLTIDRFPNKMGDYEPFNCRWTNDFVQQNNKTSNVYYNYKGENKTLAEIAAENGIRYKSLFSRIKTGQTIDQAMKFFLKKKELGVLNVRGMRAKEKYMHLN